MTSSPTTGDESELTIAPWDDSFADKGVMDAIAKARAGDEDAFYSLDILLKGEPRLEVGGRSRRSAGGCVSSTIGRVFSE